MNHYGIIIILTERIFNMTNIVDNYPVSEQEFINLLGDYNTATESGLDKPLTDALPLQMMYTMPTEDFRGKFPDSPWFEKVEEESQIEGVDDVYHTTPMLSTVVPLLKMNLKMG